VLEAASVLLVDLDLREVLAAAVGVLVGPREDVQRLLLLLLLLLPFPIFSNVFTAEQ